MKASTSLGNYEIVRQLGQGGMAEVFLARAHGLQGFEKLVVIKQILPQFASDASFVEMFLDEARIAALLQHTNVVQVYDIGSVDDRYFYSMEFLRGQDLRTVLKSVGSKGERLPLEQVLFIASSLCSGLHYAHDKTGLDGNPLNIVHRDIAPDNVFVTYDGAVKILDFGIVKSSQRSSKTRTGALKGKIGYMSPEHCRGQPLDRRADIFAVGAILWYMLTGKKLYRGNSDFEVMEKICSEPPPPPSSIVACDPELEAIVLKTLARDPADRYATADELREALDDFAYAHKLKVSAHETSRFMHNEYAEHIAFWEKASRAGSNLEIMIEEFPMSTHGTPTWSFDDDEDKPADASVVTARRPSAPFEIVGRNTPPRGYLQAMPPPDTVPTSPTAPPRRSLRTLAIGIVAAVGVTTTALVVRAMSASDQTEAPQPPPIVAPSAPPTPAPTPPLPLTVQAAVPPPVESPKPATTTPIPARPSKPYVKPHEIAKRPQPNPAPAPIVKTTVATPATPATSPTPPTGTDKYQGSAPDSLDVH